MQVLVRTEDSPKIHSAAVEEVHEAYLRNRNETSFALSFLRVVNRLAGSRCYLALLDKPGSWPSPAIVFDCDGGTGKETSFCLIAEKLARFAEAIAGSPETSSNVVPMVNLGELGGLLGLDSSIRLLSLKQKNAVIGFLLLPMVQSSAAMAEIQFTAQHFVHLLERIEFSKWASARGLPSRIVGRSSALLRTEQLTKKFAASDCPVLVRGETGSGKELIAHLIHYHSLRRNAPFVVINCGAFSSDELLASELFGHVRGAFTDAKYSKKGKFELAHQGTLFLDEVACMRPAMQVLLLRVLRYGDIQKVGDEQEHRQVNVRIIAATNRSLSELVKDGEFREDVYSRLRVARIHVPPLRERREDIPLLANYFLEQICERAAVPNKHFSPESLRLLISRPWPDNVAGLENTVMAGYLLSEEESIKASDLCGHLGLDSYESESRLSLRSDMHVKSLAHAKAEFEANYVLSVLERSSGNVSQAARTLGLSRQGLQKLLRRLRHCAPSTRAKVS
jgi:DNA-binding NtrC family response regulator